MADKLQGTWVFDKFVQERTDINPIKGAGWYLNFSSNGKQFAHLTLAGTGLVNDDYDSPNTCYIAYDYPDGVTNEAGEDYEWAFGWFPDAVLGHDSYWTIHIESKYDEVENADTLVRALSARATHTLTVSDDELTITYTTPNGVRLNTKDKYCDKDVIVKADLEDKTITANGEYTPTKGGFGKLTIAVSSDVTKALVERTITEFFEGGVESIGAYSLYKSTSLKSVNCPNVTTIGDYAFGSCSMLESVDIPKAETIGQYSFSGCTKLPSVDFPNVTALSKYAFSNCSALTSVNIPNVTTTDTYVFDKCSMLESVDFPKMKTLGNYTFNSCKKLASAVFTNELEYIGGRAFYGCNVLDFSELPSGVTTIEGYAFDGCYALSLTKLPSGLKTLGAHAFAGCKKLALTELPSGITTLPENVFRGCTALAITSLPEGMTSIGLACFSDSGISSMTFPASITTVYKSAFSNCPNLTTVTFKGTPTSINSTAFNSTAITTINVPWAEGAVANAPWGATNATINYNYTGE